jgi:hypothetical protein
VFALASVGAKGNHQRIDETQVDKPVSNGDDGLDQGE